MDLQCRKIECRSQAGYKSPRRVHQEGSNTMLICSYCSSGSVDVELLGLPLNSGRELLDPEGDMM